MTTAHKFVCARAARQEFSDAFCRGINDFRGTRSTAAACGKHLLEHLPDDLPLRVLGQICNPDVVRLAWNGAVVAENANARRSEARFKVMARKRPLLESEREAGEYDSISIEDNNNAVITHDGRVHRDGRTLYMSHSRFCLDRVFDETEGNDVVYAEAARPLMKAAAAGGRATFLLFGQTGTGKTHTAGGILRLIATDLFAPGVAASVDLVCYELAGTRGGRDAFFDLLDERKQVKCLTGEDGNVHVRGARTVGCSSASELLEAIEEAMRSRSSEATERNEASSRSHAVVELRLRPRQEGPKEAWAEAPEPAIPEGVLRIVDLAGSERNFETQQHTRKMAERGGSINYALLMLKECARLMHRNRKNEEVGATGKVRHIPFRSSRLTHLLQRCFTDEAHKTVVVTTLSPTPTDVEHSLNSLQHVGMMRSGKPSDSAVKAETADAGKDAGKEAEFGKVEGRGHALHSKLQDARQAQLKFKAFSMTTGQGGTLLKKYAPEMVKAEEWIDPRWHRELNVVVEEDLWVLREADEEAVQVLTEWHEEQWESRKSHDVVRWSAPAVQAFVRSLELPGKASLPSAMTGAQLCRLGRRGVAALCSDAATAEAVWEALLRERALGRDAQSSQVDKMKMMVALGSNKEYAVAQRKQHAATGGGD